MEKIFIFTDSASDLPRSLVEQYQIHILPVLLTHEGRTFREYYDTTPQEYWKLLSTSKEIPTTAQITPPAYLELYQKAHAEGYTHVLGVLINGKGSGCYQSACMARQLFHEETGDDMTIELVDSEIYTMMYGRTVVEAAQMRDKGAAFTDIVAHVRAHLLCSEAVMGVYSLNYLKRSGRISGGAAFVGEALGLRPVCHVYDGGVKVCGKARGDKKLLAAVLDMVKKRAVAPEKQTAGLLHGDLDAALIDEIETEIYKLGFAAVERWEIGASVITNAGPKAFAVMFDGVPRQPARP